jgi:hypothetical protein
MTASQLLAGAPSLWGLINSRSIDRFRPVLIALELGLLLIGSLFWIDTMMGGDSFSPKTWGAWACKWPAEFWAAVMIGGSVSTISGLMHPVTRARIVAGSVLNVLQFLALALSALLTGGEFVIAVFSLIFFVPMHVVLALEAAIYEPANP